MNGNNAIRNKGKKFFTRRLLRCFAAMAALLTAGVPGMWGQATHPYSGVWYMTNFNTSYYVVPAQDPQVTTADHVYEDAYFSSNYSANPGNPEMPFLTTFKTGGDLNSIWILVPVSGESNYYYIVHAKTGKYLKFQTFYSDARRKYVHLETMTTSGDTEKFEITELTRSSTTGVKIKPKNHAYYFNVAGGNQDRYNGGTSTGYYSGIIGGMSGTDDGSLFVLTDASDATGLTPVISDMDAADNTFTITSPAAAFSSFRYTTDGTTPTASDGVTTDGTSVTVTQAWNVQAVGVFEDFVTPVAGPKVIPTPPTVNYDFITQKITITCPGALLIYYNLGDGSQSDPTSSDTEYTDPISATGSVTVKAIAVYNDGLESDVAELTVTKVATPTIQDNGDNAISITTATAGATIYYTTDGTIPTTSSTKYIGPLTENVSNVTIKAIALKPDMIPSDVGSGSVTLKCATPVITIDNMSFTLSCGMPADATICYTLNGGSETQYGGTAVAFTAEQLPLTINAVARHSDYTESESATRELKKGGGTAGDPYIIYGSADYASFVSGVNNGTAASAFYRLESDISATGQAAVTAPFSGTFDGGLHTISGLTHPLFASISGGTVKNVIISEVNISSGTNVGAVAGEVTGTSGQKAFIYNCGILSGSVGGSGYVGGIVGQLGSTADADNRYALVINCFSYATIGGGTHRAGIVGYNSHASTKSDVQTMVMNCMFYGDISAEGSPTQISPVYGGLNISNVGSAGLNNYNYFRFNSGYVASITAYHCALGAEDRYLDRFEFFRHTLNSNRELAAWYITGNPDDGKGADNIMAKWVVDKTVAPYPILKPQGTYPSVINHDAANAVDIDADNEHRNEGRRLGSLTVTIGLGSGYPKDGSTAKASITKSSLTLNITDKDTANYDFNYRKVQLPYYNEVGTGNCTYNKVVTGWKITGFAGGSTGGYSEGSEVTLDLDGNITATPYNFADRKDTDKDNFNVSGRVFSQGAYYEVPDGVTGISIEPYWADCVYLADASLDVNYTTTYVEQTLTSHYTNGTAYLINGNSQKVYTTFDNARTALSPTGDNNVYDKAIVLVGNYHKDFNTSPFGGNNVYPMTIMSADLNNDNEPDYCLFYAHNAQQNVTPIRFDFISLPAISMALKPTGATTYKQAGVFYPKGWFEITNTALIRFGQFEYGRSNVKTISAPLILMGGIFEQFLSCREANAGNTPYIHVGGNAWFKEFNNGCHTRWSNKTPKNPISVSGGDFGKFYLSGAYRPEVTPDAESAECYIDGGRFGEVAGAGMQLIDGNVTWLINGADIRDFYGGGINAAKAITGNIRTTITDSRVGKYYGGPKFGDMAAGKTVTTIADGCHFGNYFGAGYGGNAYNRDGAVDATHDNTNNVSASTWNGYITTHYGRAYNGSKGGISTSFEYEYLIHSNGSSKVARFYVNYASLSLASTHDVTSTLTGCKIDQNFYGGGSLGSVNGDITSTLTDCTVKGNVFGAGFSATTPTIKVMNKSNFVTAPSYDYEAGVFNDDDVEFPASVEYTWSDKPSDFTGTNYFKDDNENGIHLIRTSTSLSNLGVVTGTVNLTINGDSKIGTDDDDSGDTGNVYGGGDESSVNNTITPANASTNVTLGDNAEVLGNVFGGGNQGYVSGSATVNIED